MSEKFERKIRKGLEWEINHNKRRVKESLNLITKDKEKLYSLKTTSQCCMQRRKTRSQKRTQGNGVTPIKSLGITMRNVTLDSGYWPS